MYELESFELIFEVFSKKTFTSDVLVGKYSIGLSTMYRNANHEYFRTWIQLINPDGMSDINKCKGYLRVSCYIVGPGERPPTHDPKDENDNEEILTDEEVDPQ